MNKIYIAIVAIIIVSSLYFVSNNRKEFPVKVGQTWTFTQEVIPYNFNRPQNAVTVEYSVKVINIDDEGNIIYSRGIDTMTVDLENFLYNSQINLN